MTAAVPAARRRWIFLALIVTAVLATLVFALAGPRPEPVPGGPAVAQAEQPGADGSTQRPPIEIPPAYLAWISGGFPGDFRAMVRTVPSLERTVVLAGDTQWMTASRDAADHIVDRPKPPYAFPIDAFAVNPVEYAPFLPDDFRRSVIGALERGQGVLSTRSAEIRGIGVGGTLQFGQTQVKVGAIAPDEAIGWSELLVSRDVGERLGIVDDRYLLALAESKPSEERFLQLVAPLLPEGTPIRVERPGGSPYMRVASGVNPPVVLKQAFGEFAAFPDPANPADLTIQPRWVNTHIRTKKVPILGRVTCNVAFYPALQAALREVEREGLASLLHTYNGCWNARTVARSPTAPPSFHAYGAAIDINAASNAYGSTPTMDGRIVAIFESDGFNWGGDFLIPDGMHFEYGEPMDKAA
jgi:hypothetical protein